MTASAEQTRELMLDAAERLFAERGIDATTVSEIHRESGQHNKSVRPAAANLKTDSGRRYLRVAVQLIHRFPTSALASADGPPFTQALEPGLSRSLGQLNGRLGHLDPPARTLRLASAIQLLAESMAARAREIDVHGCDPALDHDTFVAEVESMIGGLLTGCEFEEAAS